MCTVILSMETSTIRKLYGCTQTLCTHFTLLYFICCTVCAPTMTYHWFPVNSKSWWVPHVGQVMPTLSGIADSSPFREFMNIHIHTLPVTELYFPKFTVSNIKSHCFGSHLYVLFCMHLVFSFKLFFQANIILINLV